MPSSDAAEVEIQEPRHEAAEEALAEPSEPRPCGQLPYGILKFSGTATEKCAGVGTSKYRDSLASRLLSHLAYVGPSTVRLNVVVNDPLHLACEIEQGGVIGKAYTKTT